MSLVSHQRVCPAHATEHTTEVAHIDLGSCTVFEIAQATVCHSGHCTGHCTGLMLAASTHLPTLARAPATPLSGVVVPFHTGATETEHRSTSGL
jgi:hypothetical protein